MRKIRRKIEREPTTDVNLAKREYNRFVKHDRAHPLPRKNIVAHAREDV